MSPLQRRLSPLALVLALGFASCEGPNSALRTGALGAGLGALAGQAIGGDTEATLIGAAVGGVGGYIAGNEAEKRAARAPAPASSQPSR